MQSVNSAVLFPLVLNVESDDDQAVLALRIPEALEYFNGHFDEVAVVPGVVQIQWAVHYARYYLPIAGVFSHMDAVKFKELLLPGLSLALHLRCLDGGRKLEFCYRCEHAEYSSGRIYFHDSTL